MPAVSNKKTRCKDPSETDAVEWWRHYPCEHRGAMCSFYGHTVNMICMACNRTASFKFSSTRDEFDPVVGLLGSPLRRRDSVKPVKLVTLVRGFAHMFAVPDPPGDPAGDSPDRDARRFGEIMAIFKQHGFNVESVAKKVSSSGVSVKCSCGRHHSK